MAKPRWLGLLLLAWMGAWPAMAQESLFSEDTPLPIVIDGPIRTLVRGAVKNTAPYPATLSVAEGAEPAQRLPIQLSARGMTRRTGGYCRFPPLMLTFDKTSVRETVFNGQHELKLVTYCNLPADYEQRIVLEYLAYRLYNLVTPMSFRVRPAHVTYRPSDGGDELTRFGFLIEDLDDVAKRNNGAKLKAGSRQIKAGQLDARAAARAALFEYMIGNLDWDFLAGPAGSDCCHNSRFVAAKGATPAAATAVVPVPYDFDYSGLINAPYAGPPEGIPVAKVTDRVYRGYCTSSGEIPAVIDEFRARRAAMLALIASEPHLKANFRGGATRFIESFFALVDNPSRVQTQIISHCR